MVASTFQYGYIDIPLTVIGGVATSDLVVVRKVHSWSVKCDASFTYQLEIVDRDDFGVWASDEEIYTGPCTRNVERKCTGFKLKLLQATDGEYVVRVTLE